LFAKDAAHNPNNRIAIGVFDRSQNAQPDERCSNSKAVGKMEKPTALPSSPIRVVRAHDSWAVEPAVRSPPFRSAKGGTPDPTVKEYGTRGGFFAASRSISRKCYARRTLMCFLGNARELFEYLAARRIDGVWLRADDILA
jgi:hypothetical protein